MICQIIITIICVLLLITLIDQNKYFMVSVYKPRILCIVERMIYCEKVSKMVKRNSIRSIDKILELYKLSVILDGNSWYNEDDEITRKKFIKEFKTYIKKYKGQFSLR